MTKHTDLVVKGSVENVRNLVQQAFATNGFSVNWLSPMSGKAEKGSEGANIALGVLAQHYAVDFQISPAGEGGILRRIKSGSGMAGGLLGMRKVNKQFEVLSDTLASWFTQQGLLIGIKKQ